MSIWRKQQPEQALAAAERAVALSPNYADGYAVQSVVLNLIGRPQEAIRVAERAIRLNPLEHSNWYALGIRLPCDGES